MAVKILDIDEKHLIEKETTAYKKKYKNTLYKIIQKIICFSSVLITGILLSIMFFLYTPSIDKNFKLNITYSIFFVFILLILITILISSIVDTVKLFSLLKLNKETLKILIEQKDMKSVYRQLFGLDGFFLYLNKYKHNQLLSIKLEWFGSEMRLSYEYLFGDDEIVHTDVYSLKSEYKIDITDIEIDLINHLVFFPYKSELDSVRTFDVYSKPEDKQTTTQ